MRMMLKFTIPADVGNDVIRSGKINQVFDTLMKDLKPEAAYFYAENGQRAGHFIVNIDEESQLMSLGEPLWFALEADVESIPVMTGEDLQKGLGRIGDIIKNYG
jgi:hypothetical protein